MMSYSDYLSTKTTPQTAPIPGSAQVPMDGGGFGWKVDMWTQLRRFLILGSEGGTYYATERRLTLENAQNVLECVRRDTSRAVALITDISLNGRAPKNDPAIFALAVACTYGSNRGVAYSAVTVICRTGTHIFQFCQAIQEFGKWSRGLRRAVARFYNKPWHDLEYQLLKYKQRQGWTHRDVLRLCHASPEGEKSQALIRLAVGKQPVTTLLPPCTAAVKALHANEVDDPVKVIKEHRLTREMLPTQLLARKDVWDALLHSMPLGAMIRSLGKLAAVGVTDSNLAAASKYIADRLRDRKSLKQARIHPVAILNALRVYANGKGEKGKLTWTPVPAIKDALDDAFYLAFDAIEPTGKNFLLGVDVSASMDSSMIAGTALSAREAAAAMMMVAARTEKSHEIVFFSQGLTRVLLSPQTRLDVLVNELKKFPFQSTDCALPMIYAAQEKREVDAFVIYTDSETNSETIHPAQALRHYRETMHRPQAKMIVCAMTSNGFSIADPNDAGQMDVVGFDLSVPTLIADFVRG